MAGTSQFDAIIIGSGPNGLAAAITLARAGKSVLVREGNATLGGSVRSAALTLPGFTHDVCSTVQALARVSPFMRSLPLAEHGLELVDPPAPLAHPFDDGSAAVGERSVDATAETLGEDGPAYRKLMHPLADHWDDLSAELLAPPHLPKHPLILAKFGRNAIRSTIGLCNAWFRGERAKGLFAGIAAHSIVPLHQPTTAAFGLVLAASAHASGWPLVRGGSQKLTDAMVSYFRSLGGEVDVGQPVTNVDELPSARAIVCDITPRQLLAIAGHRLPASYFRRMERFRYGPGAFKIDYALDAPIPWTAEGCRRAGTIHIGGTLAELVSAEAAPWNNECAEKPYLLVVQPIVADTSRAPNGKHIAWTYCHVPNGSTVDMTERIERQIERFAPGFGKTILARNVMPPAALERYNANLVGGDVNGGAQDLPQLFTRPIAKLNPYATPSRGLFICSASTPPGGGVHGMCGFFAAQAVLKSLR